MSASLPAYLVERFAVLVPLYRWLWTFVPPLDETMEKRFWR